VTHSPESCPCCDARRVLIAAIDAPRDELREMDGRVVLGPDEAVVQFSALTLRQILEPVPRIEALWFGDTVMELVAPDPATGRGGRLTLSDGAWTGALANVRAELEARFGLAELAGVSEGHLH
jgi:hypothetical protein